MVCRGEYIRRRRGRVFELAPHDIMHHTPLYIIIPSASAARDFENSARKIGPGARAKHSSGTDNLVVQTAEPRPTEELTPPLRTPRRTTWRGST